MFQAPFILGTTLLSAPQCAVSPLDEPKKPACSAQREKKEKKRRHRNLAISIRYRVLFVKENVQAHFYSFFWPSFLPLRVLVQRALKPDTCKI
jgi:hypothetical protein